MYETVIALVVPALLPGAGALITGLVSLALVALKNYVKTKTSSVIVEDALTRISNTTETVVASLTQTVVTGIKQASADGKLTPAEASAIKHQAHNTILAQLPEAVKQGAALGITSLEQLVSTKIEQAVLKYK